MTDEQIDRILDGLSQVAEKLGEATEHIYGVLVRQSFVEALYWLIPALLLFAAAYAMRRYVLPIARTEDSSYSYHTYVNTAWTWVGIYGFLSIGLWLLAPAIGRIINPEYYALKELLEVLR